MKFIAASFLLLFFFSCRTSAESITDNPDFKGTSKNGIHYSITIICNKMPMSSSAPYAVISIDNPTGFKEDIQVTNLKLSWSNASWSSSTFDDSYAKGKGNTHIDFVTRNVDTKITGEITGKISVKIGTKKKHNITIKAIQIQTVY